ncbi:hypothetical protein [Sphingorhabdus sp.]|uniref:hypothetical protein n=1 Tax=Sphingorhabdus sp. TaxID=1902408 RepID=UPI0032B7BBE3
MVQERVSGNGNFDIDAIRMAANAMENPPAVIGQPFVDPVADAFAADVQDTADEIRYNPGSNLAEEAMQIMNAPGAAKLGAGVLADLRAAVQLQEEKAANGADAFMRGDRVWEERKEDAKKERAEQAKIADFADDAQNATQRRLTEREWDEGSHDFAGERMTGAEIDSLISFMRSPANRQRLIEQRARANGISTDQATRDVDNGLRYTELFRKVQMGNATTAERAEFQRLERDPATLEVVQDARSLSRGGELAPDIIASNRARNGDMAISVAGRQAQLDTGFASAAPPLRANFASALAATSPLDSAPPRIQIAAPAPPPAPPQVATAGFDV